MNKKLFTLILSSLFFISLNAQKTLDKGYIKMEITKVTSDDEQMQQMLQMMKGTQTEVYFDGKKHVTSMNMMGGMMTSKTYVDEGSDSFDMLMDAMGQKYWINSSLKDAKNSDNAQIAKDAKITYDKNDTKDILGYKAYKMTVTIPSAEGTSVTGYITEDIKTKANLMQGMEGLEIAGYPLEFTVKNPQMGLTMTTVEIKDTVDPAKFDKNTEGYKKMTMEEFTKQMGGMGMGF